MTAEYIYKYATACIGLYGTPEPENIFEQRGVRIAYSAPSGMWGKISVWDGDVIVCVDKSLGDSLARISLAHLLGHFILHRDSLLRGESFEEPCAEKHGGAEIEASIFAAELLISDSAVSEMLSCGYTEGQLAYALGALRELLSYKLFSMRSRNVLAGGPESRRAFLGRCDVEFFA